MNNITTSLTYSIFSICKNGICKKLTIPKHFRIKRKITDVVSVFSSVYDDLTGTDFFPNWGQSTTYTEYDDGESGMSYGEWRPFTKDELQLLDKLGYVFVKGYGNKFDMAMEDWF